MGTCESGVTHHGGQAVLPSLCDDLPEEQRPVHYPPRELSLLEFRPNHGILL